MTAERTPGRERCDDGHGGRTLAARGWTTSGSPRGDAYRSGPVTKVRAMTPTRGRCAHHGRTGPGRLGGRARCRLAVDRTVAPFAPAPAQIVRQIARATTDSPR